MPVIAFHAINKIVIVNFRLQNLEMLIVFLLKDRLAIIIFMMVVVALNVIYRQVKKGV